MTMLKRPVSLALVLAVSVLGGLMLERGGGSDVSGELAARSRFFSAPAPSSQPTAASLAESARALRGQIGGGVVQEHVPPFVSAQVCAILTFAGTHVVNIFAQLIGTFPGQAPALAAARQAALNAINTQLAAFHCTISFA